LRVKHLLGFILLSEKIQKKLRPNYFIILFYYSGDSRRSKQYLVNQSSKSNTRNDFDQNSDQLVQATGAPITTTTVKQTTRQRVQDEFFSTSTQRFSNFNSKNYYSDNSNKDNNYFTKKQFNTEKTSTKAPPTTTTGKLNEAQYNNCKLQVVQSTILLRNNIRRTTLFIACSIIEECPKRWAIENNLLFIPIQMHS
jgi:hypothetical protein